MDIAILDELTDPDAVPMDLGESTVTDFQRNKTRMTSTGNCVAALKDKKTIQIGFSHFGPNSHFDYAETSSTSVTDIHYLKTFSTDGSPEERCKFENLSEKGGNVYTLDQKFGMHDKVNIFENKAERGSAEEKKCTAKGGRMGTIVDIKQSADVRLVGKGMKIIRNVDLTNSEQYRSVNSLWHRTSVILDEKKGNVMDAIYKFYVHDDEGRRLIITASALLKENNGISVKIAGSADHCRLAIAPGDRVIMLPQGVRRFARGVPTAIRSSVPLNSASGVVGQLVISAAAGPPSKKAKLGSKEGVTEEKEPFSVDENFLEWIDAKPETPLTAETEFTVDEVELCRLEIVFSQLPFSGDLEEGKAALQKVLSDLASKVLDKLAGTPLEGDVNELLEAVEKLGDEEATETGADVVVASPFSLQESLMSGIMDSMSGAWPAGGTLVIPAGCPFTVSGPAGLDPGTASTSAAVAEAVDLPVKTARDALNAMANFISMASKFSVDAKKYNLTSRQMGSLVTKGSAVQRKISSAIQKSAKAQGDQSVLATIFEREATTFVEKEDLPRVHHLISKRNASLSDGGDRLSVVLNGKYDTATAEVYGNLLFNELRSAFVNDLFPVEPLNTVLEPIVFDNETHIVEVMRLFTTCDIRWMDGSVTQDIPSHTLNRARRVGHFTEAQIFPGLFATRSTLGPKAKLKGQKAGNLDEYGLVTTVVEEERIMTVRWFKKKAAASGYEFTGEDTFSTFDFKPHYIKRYSIGTVMRFVPEWRRGRPLLDLICEVVFNSDDGYQVVRFLDGEEAQLWPGQGEVLTATTESYAALDYLPISFASPSAVAGPSAEEKDVVAKMKALRFFRHTACKGECVTLLDKATPGKRLDSRDRAVSFIALNLCTFPKPACAWKDAGFATSEEMLSSEKFKNAQNFISLLYCTDGSEELTVLKEKYPEWEIQVYDLHSTNEAGISKLAEINVKHLAFPCQMTDTDSTAGFISSVSATYKQQTLCAMPFARDTELKQKTDSLLSARRKTRGLPYGSFLGKEQLSFIMRNPFSGIHFFNPDAFIYFNLSAGPQVEVLKAHLGDESITVCTLLDAEVMNTIMVAQNMVTGVDVPEEADDSESRFVDDETWDNIILQIDAMHLDEYRFGSPRENELSKKIRMMSFDFQKIFTSLALSHRGVGENARPENTRDYKEDSMLSGSALSSEVIPLTYKIDVASDCCSSEISDSYLLFHIMSQIIASDNWPTMNIEIHKNLFTDSSLDQNFVKSLICLRQAGILSGPFFDIAEAMEMSMLLTKQYLAGKGEWVTKLGLEALKEICPMLRKITSMSMIRMWKRLNAAEEFFPIPKLIDIIRRIIDSIPSETECDQLRIIPLDSAEGYLDSIYQDKLRDEIQHWIRSSSTTPPTVTTTGGTFEILDAAEGHHFISKKTVARGPKFTAKLRKEHKLLGSELPEGIDVVGYADRADLLRAVIIGPKDTPFEGFPFVFDIYLPDMYPSVPPKVHFHSFSTKGINPNLYVDGKVCISLLGTWKANTNSELWDPVKSNLLQVIMSIYTIILMTNEPYYNEPGYELRRDLPEVQAESKNYNGTVISGCLEGLSAMLRSSLSDVKPILDRHYATTIPCLLERMRSWIRAESPVEPTFPIAIDKGMKRFISSYVEKITKKLEKRARGEKDEEEGTKSPIDDGKEVSVEMDEVAIERVTNTAVLEQKEGNVEEASADELRTMFSEGDPHYDCPSFKSFIVMRQD